MGTSTAGRASTRLLSQLAEMWRDYEYCCQRLDQIQRPWVHDGPLRWAHNRRDGWHLLGSTLPPKRPPTAVKHSRHRMSARSTPSHQMPGRVQ